MHSRRFFTLVYFLNLNRFLELPKFSSFSFEVEKCVFGWKCLSLDIVLMIELKWYCTKLY